VQRDLRGSIGGIEMLFRCNIMALVGGGGSISSETGSLPAPSIMTLPLSKNATTSSSSNNNNNNNNIPPFYAPAHRVLIWDDHVPKEIGELSFRQVVLRVKLRRDAIAVALRDRIYVYHLHDLSLRDKIYTADNPNGLLSLSTTTTTTTSSSTTTAMNIHTNNNNHNNNSSSHHDMVLACPSITTGHVRVELYGYRKTVLMEAHQHPLQALALTSDGSLLATASRQGTILRVWNVQQGTQVQEFRRGLERATISCVAWSGNSTAHGSVVSGNSRSGGGYDDYQHHHQQQQQYHHHPHGATNTSTSSTCPVGWLACTSDKGTTHVFQLGGGGSNNNNHHKNSNSSLTKRLWNTMLTTATSGSGNNTNNNSGGGEMKSVAQVRGVPHPLACAFCPPTATTTTTPSTFYNHHTMASNNNTVACPLLAVAGYDVDGNGVLLVSDITPCLTGTTTTATSNAMEPRRVSYHVLCKAATNNPAAVHHHGDGEEGNELDDDDDNVQDEELRRRRRLLHTKPHVLQQQQQQNANGSNKTDGQNTAAVRVQDRITNQFQFDETEDSEFVAVIATNIEPEDDDDDEDDDDHVQEEEEEYQQEISSTRYHDPATATSEHVTTNNNDPPGNVPVGSDSVRTEPLEENEEHHDQGNQQAAATTTTTTTTAAAAIE
jgi:hypothetical protein